MSTVRGNAIVGQSGGPTSAINATLSGVIRGASLSDSIDKLYGMVNGVEGLLNKSIIDLSYLFGDDDNLNALELTPASALGSCRKKLPKSKMTRNFIKMYLRFLRNTISDTFSTSVEMTQWTLLISYLSILRNPIMK